MLRNGIAGLILLASGIGAEAAEIDNLLWSCDMASNKDYCLVQQQQFREEWPKANKGDYASQRNVAFCMMHSCDGAVKVDGVGACAWRTVIIASDGPWDSGDVTNYRSDCAGVKRDGAEMAKILFRKIYKRRMPAID